MCNSLGVPNLSADEQLLHVVESSGLTLDEVIRRAGLPITKASLSRKLRGQQVFSLDEADAVAGVFDRKVTIGRRRKAA